MAQVNLEDGSAYEYNEAEWTKVSSGGVTMAGGFVASKLHLLQHRDGQMMVMYEGEQPFVRLFDPGDPEAAIMAFARDNDLEPAIVESLRQAVRGYQ